VSRVLIIGASGQLGTALASAFADHDVLSTAHEHLQPGQIALDLEDAGATRAVLDRARPDVVLLAGAMCHVDRCEREPAQCRRINVDGPAMVARHLHQHGGRIVFFSTDAVFDGRHSSYRENDPTNPLNVYARSKLDAEVEVRAAAPDRHLIFRTGWVYGPDPQRRNFVLRLIDRIGQGERVEVASDQWGSPTFTEDLAVAVRFLVDRAETGTFHATGPELIDRVSLARMACRRFGMDAGRVIARPTSALGQAAVRPLRVLLDCSKLRAAGVPPFRRVAAGLEALGARP
jgi:dTDP-4-dehydrorhamnose reductase